MTDDDLLDLTAAERTLRKLAADARADRAAGRQPDDLFECYRLVLDELDRVRDRVHALEGEGPHQQDGRPSMRDRRPELWWSAVRGVVGRGVDGGLHCLGFGAPWSFLGRLSALPVDAVPLTTTVRPGRCGASSPMPVGRTPCCELEAGHAGWHREGTAEWGVMTTARADDPPPFAPELADAPLVTGESGSPATLVVDHPVHDSTLPEELNP